MDTVTQIALGSAVGQAVLGRKVGNKALVWGGIAGLIPDLDVIPTQFMNDVNRVAYHRSVSHSIPFALALSPMLAALARKVHPKYRQVANWWGWSLLFFLSLFTHALLDCFTTWGTQLFWPLEYRVAFQSIFVIDPLYSIPLLTGLIVGGIQNRKPGDSLKANKLGLIISSAYLALTVANKQYIKTQFEASANQQDIEYTNINTRPTPFNNLLWSANVETEKGFYIGYYSLLDEKWPVTFDFYAKQHELLPDSLQNQPLTQKLIGITQGQYVINKSRKEQHYHLYDLRFGQLAGWLDKDQYPRANQFIFGYTLKPAELGKGKASGIQRTEPEFEQAEGLLHKFWERVKGIEN
jgi:inner membrane protein